MKIFESFKDWLVSWVVVPPMLVDPDDAVIRRHAIVIDNSGMAVPILTQSSMPLFSLGPKGGALPVVPQALAAPFVSKSGSAYLSRERRHMSDSQYRKYLQVMMANIRQLQDECPKGVAIVVHGGNERAKKMLDKSIVLRPMILKDGYYPVFINWDSNMKRAYVEQLLRIRSGLYEKRALTTAPFKLLGDALQSFANLLPAWGLQVRLMVRSSRWNTYKTMENLGRFQPPPPNIEVELGGWRPGWTFWRLLQLIPAFLFQILIVLPIVGLWVPRAWDNLLRRVRAMYRAPREFDPKLADPDYEMPDGTEFKARDGAMALFLDELAKTVEQRGMKVTVIAHSMGAMVANEALNHASELPYESIVYMAPACGVRKFARAVQPILERRAGSAEAYVLTLHPRVEAGQRDLKGWIGGSVLEWLEGILTPPSTYLDRMLGKWDNVLRTLHIYEPAVREMIHVKGFPYDGKNRVKPYKHVHFNDEDVPFWTRAFWQP